MASVGTLPCSPYVTSLLRTPLGTSVPSPPTYFGSVEGVGVLDQTDLGTYLILLCCVTLGK